MLVATDAKRGQVFTKIARDIQVAARAGGGDPAGNPALRVALVAAKAANMPKENQERAIKKGLGELGGAQLEEVVYEGRGPQGVSFIVEVMTDNRNRIVAEVRHVFTKGGGQWLEAMVVTGCDALGLDWTTDLDDARLRVGDRVALQGNLDPCVLYASPGKIREQVGMLLADFGAHDGHVFNLGHGILPDVNPEHAAAMIAAVQEMSPAYHQR